jgi:hypothetical protein
MRLPDTLLALLILSTVLTGACKRQAIIPAAAPQSPAETTVAAPDSTATAAANTDVSPAAPVIETDISGNIPAVEKVNNAISDFFAAYGRAPKDVNELVRLKFLAQAPAVPAGRKIVIDPVRRQASLTKQ